MCQLHYNTNAVVLVAVSFETEKKIIINHLPLIYFLTKFNYFTKLFKLKSTAANISVQILTPNTRFALEANLYQICNLCEKFYYLSAVKKYNKYK